MTAARQRKRQFFSEVNARGGRERWALLSKWCGLFLRTSFIAALLCGLYFGATRGWNSLFWRNPDYALKDITVTNHGSSLTRDQIIAAAGVKLGQNILAYSLPEIKAALRKLPQIGSGEDDVKVLRYLPNRMEIDVTERKPVAWITARVSENHLTTSKSYLVDEAGAWFRPKQVLHEYQTLPVIIGVVTENLEPGKPIQTAELNAALELIQKNTAKPHFQARSLDITKGYCVIVKDQNGTQITFGLEDIDSQLVRLEAARKAELDLSQQIATVNVMLTRNIPITWVPPLPPEESDFPPKPIDTAKPPTKDLKVKQVKKPETKPLPKKEPKKTNPDNGLYKPFLLRA